MEQSHILNLLIMGADSTVPVTAANSYITDYTCLDDGAFSVCNDQNMVLDANTVLTDDRVALNGIRLVGRYDTKLVYSDFIKASEVVTYRGIATHAAAEQISYIGYTGSGNSISVINANTYNLTIHFYQTGRTGQGRDEYIDIMYKSDDAATATSVAFGLMGNLVPSLKKQPESTITADVINSVALVNNDRLAHALTVVNGSKYATVATDWTTSAAVVPAVGDLLRLGSATGTNAAVALGSPVYKIISFPGSALVVELDRPYTGTSAALTASTSASVIPIANVGNYGIRLTGVAPTWTLGKRPWQKVAFTIGLTNFGSTAITYSTASDTGQGLEDQIKDLEWFTNGEGGDKYRGDYMYQGYTSRVTSGHTYDQLAITWIGGGRNESISGSMRNPKQLIIANDTVFDEGDANDIVLEVLDAYTTIASGLTK
jgi:hypothetical protein